jgi:membrane associated rhomboid family serine protease
VIPLKDDIPTRSTPVVTVVLIVTNLLVFLWQASLGPEENYGVTQWGLVPIEFRGLFTYAHGAFNLGPFATLFTSMFMHGGLAHLAGNMLFLWVFGNNVEEAMSRARFLVFYLVCGVIAGLTQVYATPDPTVSMIGASGAISGVLGAYLVLYPHARIQTLVPLFFYFTVIRVPAFFFLVLWFLMQLLSGAATYSMQGSGIAFLAHVGGFAAGFILVRAFRRRPEVDAYV